MDQEKIWTLEEIESHLDKSNIEQYSTKSREAFGVKAIAASGNFCGIYKAVRPILVVITKFPLIPAKIKRAIEIFIQAADTICP